MASLLSRLLALGFLLAFASDASVHGARAQQQPGTTQAAAPAQQSLKPEQLEQLVAPIALYPDTLLAEVLMASTYPLEVVEASRWADENKNLKDDALKTEVDKQSWEDSVKALVATPSVLSMMSNKLSWMQQLGDAVLAQQPDVMDAVQRLRTKAQANNKLQSTKEQKVSVRSENSKQIVVIEPTVPNTVYVPYYDPAVVYGPWPYPAYPPYYWPAPGYIAGGLIATGIAFGAGYALGRWASGGGFWGGGMNWGNNNININRNVNINNIGNNNNWQHRPEHRQGVRYNNSDVAKKFNQNGNRGGVQDRMDFRGRNGQQVLNPGAGNRPGQGAGDRPGQGPGAGNRPSQGGGNRPGAGAGNRPNAGGGNRPATRPSGGGRDNAFGNVGGGGAARAQAQRGRASMGGGGGGGARMGGGGGGGGARMGGGGGGGGARGGGGGGGRGGGGGGGGRRSDINLKHDIALLGTLDNGLGFYRFSYIGSDKAYVGVIAQEVKAVAPAAVTRGVDGYLRVRYDQLGVRFQSYEQWIKSGAQVPAVARFH